MLSRPTVNLNGHNASLFENLESCIVYLYSSNEKYRVLCEVAKSEDHMMLGRKQALVVGYISFPEILQPTKIGKSIQKSVWGRLIVSIFLESKNPVFQWCQLSKSELNRR